MTQLTQEQLWRIRGMIQRCGWGEFMMHIGSLMAEQSDKIDPDSKQSTALRVCSQTVHALREPWGDCGTFDYLNNPLTPEEMKKYLSQELVQP